MFRVLALSAVGVFAAWSHVAVAQQVSYPIYGTVYVATAENAVERMAITVAGVVEVAADDTISGNGYLSYLEMAPCAWAPPETDNGKAPWCRIDGVSDGGFKIEGKVLERLHRHDDDNDIKDAVFAFADTYASERLDYAPARIQLTFTPTGVPEEKLAFWGFSTNRVEARSTGAAALGLLSSTLFDGSFELTTVPPSADTKVPDAANFHNFSGSYAGGTPVVAEGSLALVDFDPAYLPKKTEPAVYLSTWVEAPADRPLTAEEAEVLDPYKTDPEPQTDEAAAATTDDRSDRVDEYNWTKLGQDVADGAFQQEVLNTIRPFLLRPGG